MVNDLPSLDCVVRPIGMRDVAILFIAHAKKLAAHFWSNLNAVSVARLLARVPGRAGPRTLTGT